MAIGVVSAREEKIVGPNGRGIFVRWWRPDTQARAVVAICHGVNSHSGYYIWAAERLVERGFAVYALDLPGRGKSDGERFYVESIDEYIQAVDALVDLAKSREPALPLY